MIALRPYVARRCANRKDGGFTMPEILVAAGVGTLVLAAFVCTLVWCYERTSHARHLSWSENQALISSRNIISLLRNSAGITAMDTTNGNWVQVARPNGTQARLVYVDVIPRLRDGYLYLTNSPGASEVIIARGMTKIPMTGFSPPIFSMIKTNTLRICYRVVEPVAASPGEYNDQLIGAIVDTSVYFRNGPR